MFVVVCKRLLSDKTKGNCPIVTNPLRGLVTMERGCASNARGLKPAALEALPLEALPLEALPLEALPLEVLLLEALLLEIQTLEAQALEVSCTIIQ